MNLDFTSKAWALGAGLQGAIAGMSLLALTFSPGEVGRTLLIPINGRSIDPEMLKQLTLRPLQPGPLPGSVVVEGRGRSLVGTFLGRGILMLAAPAAICGGPLTEGGAGNA